MFLKLGERFTDIFQKNMPSAFVFAILLTIITALVAFLWMDATPINIIGAWYDGFFDLLTFGMQITLIIITGFAIALSPFVKNGINKLSSWIKIPAQVYGFVLILGSLLTLISFGWIVITCVIARTLAKRIKGVNYMFLVACVYFSSGSWVTGLSSSIPLLLNTENNYLIQTGVLEGTVPTSMTLGSTLNITMIFVFLVVAPIVFLVFAPKTRADQELKTLLKSSDTREASIQEAAESYSLPYKALSDTLNNGFIFQYIVAIMGVVYIVYHFVTKGFDLNFNIMIFMFLMLGLLLHKTPLRYSIAMKRASSNISGILFQYPFYAGIMGIMLYTGLGGKISEVLVDVATIDSYPFYAYVTGGFVNFAIPSAGGEFAVIGPSIIEAVKVLGAGLPQEEVTAMISRASLAIAYGESASNAMQPFYLLLVLPIMGNGVKFQARDVLGYLVFPFIIFFIIQSLMVVWLPM